MLTGPKERTGISHSQATAYALVLVISLVFIFLLGVKGMRFFLVPSASMEPTLVPPEYLITFEQDLYYRGDIVVIKDPKVPGSYLVKRIVGLPGDTLAVRGGALFINGSYASEPYSAAPMNYIMNEYTVKDGDVFIMGDNRNASVDSHDWQADVIAPGDLSGRRMLLAKPEGVSAALIVGKVRCVYLPINRARITHSYPLTNTVGV